MTMEKRANRWVVLFLIPPLLLACRLNRPSAGNTPATDEPSTVPATSIPSSPPESQTQPLQFVTGRNEYVINVDDTPREFIVYVPAGYDPTFPIPVVYMIHGSNQSGKIMYENTHWARKAEEENIIIVYPTSWKYRTTEANRVEDKWNTPGTEQIVVPGAELKDDVKFMRMILDNLHATFNIDDTRIFASGFSNGGGFVLTRLIPEMNDVFAAYSTAGAGLIGEAGVQDVPIQVSESLYSILGTNDNKISENQGIPLPFPLDAQEILDHPSFGPMIEKTTTLLSLDTIHTVESNPTFTRLTFDTSLAGADNEYIFLMLRGLFHVYPDGGDNRAGIDAADEFWNFFLRHPKP
jgi:polyhydroxybutyrate depolymerase